MIRLDPSKISDQALAKQLGIELEKKSGRQKYGNKKTEVDGLKFDSSKEAQRYSVLIRRKRLGKISDLTPHESFDLIVNGIKICRYEADFSYVLNDQKIVEDVKSEGTSKNRAYRMKLKLMKACLGIDVKEVHDIHEDYSDLRPL